MGVTGRVAVVTGAGSGIGAAVTLALAADGWTVVMAGRHIETLQHVAAQGEDVVGDLVPVPTDVSDESSVRALFDGVSRDHGRIDLLFNNAGIGAPSVGFDELELSDWRAVVDVNLTGSFLCAREAFRLMRRQLPQGGRIINNGSISAHAPRPLSAPYTATKHAVTGLTKSLALDGRPYDIACSQIDIGNAASDMSQGLAAGTLQADGSVRPEPRMDVAEVGRAVAYMAGLPLSVNVATMTIMATKMPFVGRG